ncbi:MAG TPA: hypothetical protein VIV40_32965 [Kofleriaceae bacterium]
MKLAALFCVAAMSVVGCGSVESNGGGQGDGISPSKTELQVPSTPGMVDLEADHTWKQKLGTVAANFVCDGCVMTTYQTVDTSAGIDEVRVVSDGGGFEVCRIYLDQNQVVVDECGLTTP